MNETPGQEGDDIGELMELSLACPLQGGNPKDCQFHHIRKMSPGERLVGILGLSKHSELTRLRNHDRCMARKQSAS